MTYRDRNENYVPDGLYTSGNPHVVEVRGEQLPICLGLDDELNREQRAFWVDVSGDGSHWSIFRGHRIHVDVALHTSNRREVNDWKGRDEIRAEGFWTLALNRQQCWEGLLGDDPTRALYSIPRIIAKLQDHSAIDWFSATPVKEQLEGRRVYYDRTPAVVSSACVLDQGCVMLKPVGVDAFPPAVWALEDADEDSSGSEEAKVTLLDEKIWWWRDKAFGNEEPTVSEPEPPGKAAAN